MVKAPKYQTAAWSRMDMKLGCRGVRSGIEGNLEYIKFIKGHGEGVLRTVGGH